jgi:hypothetical protein
VQTNSYLVSNLNEKMVSSDAWAVTTTVHNKGPNARSVFKIQHANQSQDPQIRYGQDIRISTVP